MNTFNGIPVITSDLCDESLVITKRWKRKGRPYCPDKVRTRIVNRQRCFMIATPTGPCLLVGAQSQLLDVIEKTFSVYDEYVHIPMAPNIEDSFSRLLNLIDGLDARSRSKSLPHLFIGNPKPLLPSVYDVFKECLDENRFSYRVDPSPPTQETVS